MIDPNEAPEGYRAEEKQRDKEGNFLCLGCDFLNKRGCSKAPCLAEMRSDCTEVILKCIGPVMAIYATPCDDMGAHV